MRIKWTDVHEIGYQLSEAHADLNPMEIRFTELHRLVRELPEFEDDPKKSNEKILEAIQMAWLEELE